MVLYNSIGRNYADLRRPDRRIASGIDATLGDAANVVDVGAGAGSYEPLNRTVLAVEPSEVMIQQRPAGAATWLQGSAEALPLGGASFDAAMAVLTIHHWTDLERGLAEVARVARKRVALLTWVPDARPFWLTEDYFPETAAIDRKIFPRALVLTAMLERVIGPVDIEPVPISYVCTDGFLGAYWRRPESYLNADVRSAVSGFTKIDADPGLAKLCSDLDTGYWAERNHHLLGLEELDLGYRIFRCEIPASL